MAYYVLILVAVLTAIYFYVKKKQSYWEEQGINYVKPKFFFGSQQIGKNKKGMWEMQLGWYNQLKNKGNFGGFYLFTRPFILPTDLDFIKLVLIKDFQYFHDRGMYVNEKDDPLTGHLFSLGGTKWRNLRNKLSPTFTSGKLKMMFPLITDIGVHFHECFAKMVAEENVIEVKDVLARFTTDVIATCAFGLDCNSLNNPETDFRKFGAETFKITRAQIIKMSIVLSFEWIGKLLSMKLTRQEIEDFYMGIVRETINYREKNNVVRNDFMNLLIELKNKGCVNPENGQIEKVTFNEIAAQAFIFFLGGFETSSTTMTFCLYELALNPDIQEKARQHINEVLAKHDNKITYEAVSDMTYLDQIINETLRMFPPVAELIRKVTMDYEVPDSKHILKKDVGLFIPVYAIHHDPEIYENPEKFDPDRFSKENIQQRHISAFLPFGEGPRICIGQRFGMLQTRIGLVTLLRNFKFSPCEKTLIPMELSNESTVLSPKGGMYLKVEKI